MYDYDLSNFKSVALIFGNEEYGIPMNLVAEVSAYPRLFVPMSESIRSYNLSNTVALTVSELRRQQHTVMQNLKTPTSY